MQLPDLVRHAKENGGFRETGSTTCFCDDCCDPVTSYYVFQDNWPFVAFFCAVHRKIFSKMLTYDLTEEQAISRVRELSSV